ncbi:MICOS complex subunit MIC60 isoform X1 [Gadus macrocephalus]|uniref:MICOS complex subunit MIC60 isoform X1 n=1 Tax=Gadus macrocephalus TaxID=80720 RepID=UPI0028CB15E2|nr:MICOS complex subunit MIC60 isoform X1 [Gadus macrocephalus]
MLRLSVRAADAAARRRLCQRGPRIILQHSRPYTEGNTGGSAAKIVAAGLVSFGGGIGGTVLYAKWDSKFRTTVEKNVPYSDLLFGLALGPATSLDSTPTKKQLELAQPPSLMLEEAKSSKNKAKKVPSVTAATTPASNIEEASAEASHIISAMGEVPSVPAPQDTEAPKEQCEECHQHSPPEMALSSEEPSEPGDVLTAPEEPLKERPAEEVTARIAQQDQADQDTLAFVSDKLEDSLASSATATLQAIAAQEAALQAILQHTQKLKEAMETEVSAEQRSSHWKDLEDAVCARSRNEEEAGAALVQARASLDSLRAVVESAKDSRVAALRPMVLAAEENLHSMTVDLDRAVDKVQSVESEAKIVSQYSELVNEAKQQFQRELSSITPEIQANWKGLSGTLSVDDLNALIAHAHRRIDQLNREMAEHRVREQVHIEAALEQQKLEDQKALEKAVSLAVEHNLERARLEQERKQVELREVMEAEMRTQLRRQAAAHTDHLRDVLKVQEQELQAEAEEVLSSKMMEQETRYRQLTQEQLDNFTLDMNAAYARLKGMEEAIDSHVIAEEEARKAHQLWLSVEALGYTLRSSSLDSLTQPLEPAAQAIRESCQDEFAVALAAALPEESLQRGVYSEESLRARFNALRSLARRVALVDESHNSLYQYFLSYLQAALLFEERQEAPPAKISSQDLDPFKILSYASYSLEQGDLELAAKLVNQLRGEARRVVQDWLVEARLTLETKQVVSLLSAYANAVGLGTTQAP